MSSAPHAILIATLDPKKSEMLDEMLGSDYPLKTVAGPREALECAQMEDPGLILFDAGLPDADLGAFNRKLKSDPRTSGIPLLLIVPSETAATDGMEKGANDCLVYPFRPAVASARIRNYMDLGRCIEALRRFSLVDTVTGIANRRRFDEFLVLEWRRNLRNKTPLSLVIMDLDHFHAYNERYGTAAGDEALKRIAKAFDAAIQRPGDLLASYSKGGFACVLPETDTLGAVSVAERMRAELATLAIPHEESSTAPILTMSVGTATRTPSPDLEAEDLLELAERSMTDAKRAGRNRVMFGG